MDKLQRFVIWLDAYIDAIDNDFNVSKTNVIKNKLNDLFEHEADKLEEPKKTLEELGKEHGFNVNQGFPKNNSNGLVRC